MNNSLINKLIIAAGVILVILIIVTILTGSLFKKNGLSSQQPTLIPTGVFEQSDLGGRGSSKSQKETMTQALRNNPQTSEGDFNRLDDLKSTLPVDTTDFTFTYSSDLDHFIAAIKTPDGKSKFQQYLVSNGFDDLFVKFPTILTVGSGSIDQIIQDVGNTFQQQLRQLTSTNKDSSKTSPSDEDSSNPDLPSLSFSQLSNLMGSLFTLGQGGDVNKAVDKSNQELGQQTNSSGQSNGQGGGGGPPIGSIQGRTVGKTIVPEGPNCKLTPIQIAAAAVIARYKNTTTTQVDWNWVTEATAVGLAESDGLCNDSYPSTNSWGLWEIDAQNAGMSVSNTALYDPLLNAQAMWRIYSTRLESSRRIYGTNWGAYWSTGRPDKPRFFKKVEFYNPAQQAASQLKSQL